MGVPLSVDEWMKGYVGFGADDCDEGSRKGLAEGTRFEHGVTIRMRDIDLFVAEPTHDADMDGYVECERLGGKCTFTGGKFNMLVDAADPLVKYMFYRIPFANERGEPYTMLGHKTLRDDRGPDLWADITTLEIRIFEGHEVQGPTKITPAMGPVPDWKAPPIAMGVLRIEFFDGVKSALSFKSGDDVSRIQKAVAIKKFCGFYGSRLWDLFSKLRPRDARANEWTATEAFRAEQRLAPVKWLLAGDLLRRMAKIVRSSLGNELDLRDWMTHDQPIDFRHEHRGDGETTGRKDIWFDYIADTGDDTLVMQVLAKLLGQRFVVAEPSATDKLIEIPDGVERPEHALEVGPFVFVGGDTAYHVADETTLRHRFVEPFRRAVGVTGEVGQKLEVMHERHLFGIPGNHDYYDNLVGFNRMFRRPFHQHEGVLQIPGYPLRQEASYVKILLPGGWQLWGADLANGLDYRQWRYFGTKVPDKLILCVPTPPVTFDHVRVSVEDEDDEETRAYRRMFGMYDQPLEFRPDKIEMPDGTCRLHIAGDDHHYARYDDGKHPSQVTSIVSGGGGAFMHPTETTRADKANTVTRRKTYPEQTVSAKLSAQVVNPIVVFSAGLVHVAGAALAMLLYATHPANWRELGPAGMWIGALAVSVLAVFGAMQVNKRFKVARGRLAKAIRPASPHDPTPQKTAAELAREQAQLQRDHSWSHRWVRPIVWTLALGIASASPFVAKAIDPRVDPLSGDTAFLFLAALVGYALTSLGRSRGPNAGVGILHAFTQLGLPLSIVVAGTWVGLAIAAALWLVFAALAGRLYCSGAKWSLAALWFLQGPCSVAAIWLAWRLGWGTAMFPDVWWMIFVAGAVGMVVSATQFGWYLLVSIGFGAHNNEVGAAIRTTEFKQWIRFHVTEDRVTGYVIGVDDPKGAAKPKLVDVFHVAPRPAVEKSRAHAGEVVSTVAAASSAGEVATTSAAT